MTAGGVARTGWEKADAWEQELTRRMGMATQEDTLRGMFFNGTLEVLRELGAQSLMKRCVEDSGESQFLDFFNYPVRMHGRMVATALPVLVQEYGGPEEALRRLGRLVATRFLRMGVGKVMRTMIPLGPRQLQTTLPIAYRSAVSFGQYSVRWTGPTKGRFILVRDFMPHPFHEGVLEASLEMWGARSVKVTGRQTGGLDSECDFCWQ